MIPLVTTDRTSKYEQSTRELHARPLGQGDSGHRKPKQLEQVCYALHSRHHSRSTEKAYVRWTKRFIFFHNVRHPAEMAAHEKDLVEGWGRVRMPTALDRKYPNARKEWRWQWVFPQDNRWKSTKTGGQGRHHVDESMLQKAFKRALGKSGFTKRATFHTPRHSFATHYA